MRTEWRTQARKMLEGRPRAIEFTRENPKLRIPRRDRGGLRFRYSYLETRVIERPEEHGRGTRYRFLYL